MLSFELYNDSTLTSVAANIVCGSFTGARMFSSGSEATPQVYIIRDDEQNEVGRITIIDFETCTINDTMATSFPIGTPASSEPSNFRYYYTAGKTKIGVKYWESGNDTTGYFKHIAIEYPYLYNNGGYIELPFTNSTQYNWIYHRTIPLEMFSLIGVYFVHGTFTYQGQTYNLLFPTIKVQSVIDTSIIEYWSYRSYTTNVITGYGNIEQYTPTGNNTSLGGTGNGQYNGTMPEVMNVAARNAAFSITSGTGEGLTYYYVNARAFNQIISYVYGHHMFNDIEKYINCCVGAHILPIIYTPDSGNIGRVFISNTTVSVDVSHIINNRLVYGSMGSADLTNSGYDDYNDFVNTTATLYLPFVGRISIDINAIARGTLSVEYMIDLFNGNVGYWVYTQSKDAELPILYGTYTGNCAIEIPLCGSGMSGNVLGKILNAGTSIASGFAQNPAKGVVNTLTSLQTFTEQTVNRAGVNDTNSSSLVPYQCRLDIERKEVIRTENYTELAGIPAFDTVKISEVSGFIKAHSVDLSGLVCEQSERDEIRRLLESGVYA